MSFLEVLLAGRTLDESLAQSAKKIKSIGNESKGRVFRVTKENGFTVTELYPNSKPLAANYTNKG